MARHSNVELAARVKELEALLDDKRPMPIRVRAYLKDIVRQPERAVQLATEALRLL